MSIFCVLNIYPTFFFKNVWICTEVDFQVNMFVAAVKDDQDAHSSSKRPSFTVFRLIFDYWYKTNAPFALHFGQKFEVLTS